MYDCSVIFPGPVSRSTMCCLVVDYLKYVLYYRGQLPLPLEQLKSSLKSKQDCTRVVSQCKENAQPLISRSAIQKRKDEVFTNQVTCFDDLFERLHAILLNEDVIEVVLNLGANMMLPREFYRILMPTLCRHPDCNADFASPQRCRLMFFRSIMNSSLWNELKADGLTPVSILLLLGRNVELTENMEWKNFYTPPTNCKQRVVKLASGCSHCRKDKKVDKQELTNSVQNSKIWVKLKPELKGFKCQE